MIIVEEETQTRIDSYLATKLDISRSKIQKLIKEGKVLVNDKLISANYLVKLNDQIQVNDELNYEISVEPENIPLDIVYEDDDLLVINKASGMVVHPAPGHYTNTLVNALLYRFNITSGDKMRPGIVHRLDKDTSGLMLVAKNEETHEKLSKMIGNKEVERRYLAITTGVIKTDTGTIDAPIGRDQRNRLKMQVTDVNAKEAITHFKVLKRYKANTLIECILETGRTHQIRVHMSHIGHGIIGDELYGYVDESLINRQALHAYSLSFNQPRTKENLEFKAELPNDIKNLIEKLRKNN